MRAILLASSPIRSRLAVALENAINKRRSRAVGWRRAMMVESSRSMSTSSALTRVSSVATVSTASRLNCDSARMAWPICDSTNPPSSITRADTVLSSVSNCEERCFCIMKSSGQPKRPVM